MDSNVNTAISYHKSPEKEPIKYILIVRLQNIGHQRCNRKRTDGMPREVTIFTTTLSQKSSVFYKGFVTRS